MVPIFWGLAAAFMLGVADLAAREAGKREGSLHTLLFVQLIGSPLTFILVLIGSDVNWLSLFSAAALIGAASGILLTFGNILFYQALVKGPILIVAPLSSSFAIVTIALSLLSGERPMPTQLLGIIITLGGILLAATARSGIERENNPAIEQTQSRISSGIALAIAAAVLFGVAIWVMKLATLKLGSQFTTLLLRQTSLVVMIVVFLVTRRSASLRSRASLRWIIPVALLDTLATWSISIGLQSGLASVVSVITSLYSVVTILLGYVLLGERITRSQQIGVGFTLAGVALASL
jgi:drug/metabolite transporter (DMT)-like permease